jgi:hypothetical protein
MEAEVFKQRSALVVPAIALPFLLVAAAVGLMVGPGLSRLFFLAMLVVLPRLCFSVFRGLILSARLSDRSLIIRVPTGTVHTTVDVFNAISFKRGMGASNYEFEGAGRKLVVQNYGDGPRLVNRVLQLNPSIATKGFEDL